MIPVAKPHVGAEEIAAAERVLRSGHLVQGREVAAFEDEFGGLVAGRHCVAVNSGTSALTLALMALGVGPGDEVVVPSFTFAGTVNAIRVCGAVPVFGEVDERTFCLSAEAAASAVNSATTAIVAVHLYGQPADMTALSRVAARHGLAVVEDAAQAHGASWRGTPVGALGDAAAFSFYPTKNMHAIEGGMVVTPDPRIAERVRLLRNQGMAERYRHVIAGHSLRLTEVAAAVGRVQLSRLACMNRIRSDNAARLTRALSTAVCAPPCVAEGATHVYHQYTIRIHADHRASLRRFLEDRGIQTEIYYPVPAHRLPPYLDDRGLPGTDLPVTDRCAAEVLSLPVHPALSRTDLDTIASAVRDFGFP